MPSWATDLVPLVMDLSGDEVTASFTVILVECPDLNENVPRVVALSLEWYGLAGRSVSQGVGSQSSSGSCLLSQLPTCG